jgi:large subunit ribosomal protein L17
VDTVEAAHELVDVIGAQTKRQGGYVRLKKAGFRSGDNTPLATVSFVDTFNKEAAKRRP